MARAPKAIRLRGVRQNNLRGFDLEIPVGKLTVVTGPSGAGKSSLVFETLHAEGQRRYVETFNAYTRQFLERMGRPAVDSIENIRPSIAIEQRNSVRTSRSTVGTMTELCDFFKAWFPAVATLFDPATGRPIADDSPQSAWNAIRSAAGDGPGAGPVLVGFEIGKPGNLGWEEILAPLRRQGYVRGVLGGEVVRLEDLAPERLADHSSIVVLQDRLKPHPSNRNRFLEAAATAFRHGHGTMVVLDADGGQPRRFSEGLRSPETGRRFRPPQPSLFSFNSPIGACPTCRGFGRTIGLDPDLVVPDPSLSLDEGAIRPFQGKVYSNSLDDLRRHADRAGLRMDVPWRDLDERERRFVWEGEPDYPADEEDAWMDRWYGIRRFFGWLERNVYKMHVRVFLSKYRSYDTCPDCGGQRLGEESRCWKWDRATLPELYRLEVSDLLPRLEGFAAKSGTKTAGNGHGAEGELLGPILQRLRFLDEVGLGYLTLDRPTRTLSGGETERVNLTTCLGTSMVDTLFVLDEPSVGLHPRDIDRLVGILRGLAAQGNTVVVVEHDERIMRAADRLVEIGPEPGRRGGRVVCEGPPGRFARSRGSLTAAYLRGEPPADPGEARPDGTNGRHGDPEGILSVYGATKHNLRGVDLHLPLRRFVCVSGVSGSGKSTLLHKVLHDNLLRSRGQPAEDPAEIRDLDASAPIGEVVRIDQSGLSKTPRSNPAVLTGAWEEFRKAFARTEEAVAAGMTAGTFSFNAGEGRCGHCEGLGYEQVEMQFLSDLFLPCPVCGGKRFKPEILALRLDGRSIDEILRMEVGEALGHFGHREGIRARLEPVARLGLGYLPLGHPLNQLSGGEAQRLKLVRHLGRKQSGGGALILVDEPTTGLHRHDVARLLAVFRELVGAGNSLVVVEHHPDVLLAADHLVEMGPGAGSAGGRIVAAGTPAELAEGDTETAPFLREALRSREPAAPAVREAAPAAKPRRSAAGGAKRSARPGAIEVEGATEHNLRDVSVSIPHGKTTVVTGVSGSGKSTLAFDIVFAEGQRRFLESMSPYARQFVEQLPKPAVRRLSGLAPSVAIEQRVNRGTAKSTVATITEVAQYLRLLFARIGIQHNPRTGNAVHPLSEPELLGWFEEERARRSGERNPVYLGAPLVRGRKGHHQPIADWAASRGFPFLVCDGKWVEPAAFRKLDRYREHDLDLILGDVRNSAPDEAAGLFREALRFGRGTAFLRGSGGGPLIRHFSRSRVDPETGEAFPELDPKHFSWNSPRGWCPACRGRGTLAEEADDPAEEPSCPRCGGTRLGEESRHVFLETTDGEKRNLPALLSFTAPKLIATLGEIRCGPREKHILGEIIPEIRERLQFMEQIGLDYLTLDRATRTLSGGEAQRIRLTSQLGSNLTGVLYVLDEPTIGLHARDNDRLLASIDGLKRRGNTVLVVEHDEEVIRAADRVVDMGPGAGEHGGEIVATGTPKQIAANRRSVTGRYLRRADRHPLRGNRRPLPSPARDWFRLDGLRLRNWKGGEVRLPRRRLVAVCGVSGAGKSTLVLEGLRKAARAAIRSGRSSLPTGFLRELFPVEATAPTGDGRRPAPLHRASGFAGLRKVVEIDQSPIGKTSRSTPATYIGVFDLIRASFASLPEARMRGLGASAFSFNTAGGRCEACKGAGRRKLEMNFLPDASVVCEECGGRRYRPDLLGILWRDRSIADVLRMSFEEAARFFEFDRRIQRILGLMVETGLGYLRLGQPSPTLSGGEAQRLKLVAELAEAGAAARTGENLYLLEEPTIGLHLGDCARLTALLHRLVDEGHTVVVIEHQADILAEADYLLEIGPGGGDRGGELVFAGLPEELAERPDSPTGPTLRPLLETHRKEREGNPT